MKNVGNSSDGRSQGVPKISGHPCVGRMGALRGHLCDSTAFLLFLFLLGYRRLQNSGYFDGRDVNCYRKSLNGPVLQQSEQHTDLLSPEEFRWFWISWSNDVISCGKGNHVGHDVICSYRDPSPFAVNFMSVGTAQSYSSYWLIPSQYYDTGIVACILLFIELFI